MIKVSFAAENAALSFTELEVAYGTDLADITYPEVTPADGFHLEGWETTEGVITAEITINAITALNRYTVNFIGVDGGVVETETVLHGGAVSAPEVPVREGFTAIGWADAEGNIVTDFSTITTDATFTAAYEQIMIKVSFAAENATLSFTELEVAYGTDLADITYPEVTVNAGYRHIGWDTTAGIIKEDATVTALFALNSYTVIFKDNSGTVISTQKVLTGFTAIAPAAPVIAGCNFVGWADENGNIVSDFSNISADTVFTATYDKQIVTYTVIFKGIDGTVISRLTVEEGGTATAPEAPKLNGYSFAGWASENGIMVSDFSNISASATYTACYKVSEYTEHFVITDPDIDDKVIVSENPKYLYFKAGSMTVADVAALFANENISISKANGSVLANDAIIATSFIITSEINGSTESRTIIVLGDVNGDGRVNATDYGIVLNCAKGRLKLANENLMAANVASPNSETINAADYGLILNFAKGKLLKFATVLK